MPWTPEEFRQKHGKHLSPGQAKRAAAQANAILQQNGGNEGVAIATALKNAGKSHAERMYPDKEK